MALRVAVRLGAEVSGEVFRAPGQRGEPRARIAIGAGEEQRPGGLGRDGDDLDVPVGQAGQRLAGRELGVGMHDAGAAFRLRQHDGVGPRRHHGIEVGIGEAGREAVDAHQEARPGRAAARGRAEKGGRRVARRRLALRRDRILKVDDNCIGAAAERLVELGRGVGGHEQQRTHSGRRMRMKALRRHSATSLSSWL